MRQLLLSILILTLSSTLASSAKSDSLTTFELGGASNSPGIADKGSLIIEEKFFHYDKSFTAGDPYNYILGDTKLRLGLIENKLEARLYSRGVTINQIDTGFTNTSLGLKFRLNDETESFPSNDVIVDFQIPLGDRDLRNPGFNHSYMLVSGKQFTKKFGNIINLALDFSSYKNSTGGTDTAAALPYVFNLNYNPNSKLNIFSHIFGAWFFDDNFRDPLAVDTGAAYAINNDLVLVGWISKGLNDNAPALSIDLGLVYRL